MAGAGHVRRGWRRGPAALMAVALATGCARVTPTASPTPTPPTLGGRGPEPLALDVPRRPEAPPPEAWGWDPILQSPVTRDPGFQEEVRRWEAFWSGQEGSWFPLYLKRMSVYEPLVEQALADAGLPASLRYLPLIESGYSPRAVSSASAVGLWQFMASTARARGLAVGPLLDERRDPVKATLAAVAFLRDLRDRFGSWYLALGAYNGGPARMERLLAEHGGGSPPSDSLFLTLAPFLPRETREYVPRLLAAARVAQRPDAFGLLDPATLPPPVAFVFDEVNVPDATSLDVVAKAAGVDEAEVVALNPQLVRRVTPRGRTTTLRVPPGTGVPFEVAYARIPPDRRVTVTEHVVAKGETMWGIARQYGVSLDALVAANPRIEPRRLQPGHRLLVPLVPGARVRLAAAGRPETYRVRSGDTLWDLARRYDVGVEDLKRWNGLSDADVIQPGQRLRLGGG